MLAWFGYAPSFHDAHLLEISLSSRKTSSLQIHAFNMTDQTDAEGYFILDKHVVVTMHLEDVSHIALSGLQSARHHPSSRDHQAGR